MKKTKIYSGLFFVMAIALFIYPVITGSSVSDARSTCSYTFNMVGGSGTGYTYCIGNGESIQVEGNPFGFKVECGQSYSVCVSNGSYIGNVFFSVPCPCSDTTINITMISSSAICECNNSTP